MSNMVQLYQGLLDPKYPTHVFNACPYKRIQWKHVSCKDPILSITGPQLRSLPWNAGVVILHSTHAVELTRDWLKKKHGP